MINAKRMGEKCPVHIKLGLTVNMFCSIKEHSKLHSKELAFLDCFRAHLNDFRK
jgi:hypothetical protein